MISYIKHIEANTGICLSQCLHFSECSMEYNF